MDCGETVGRSREGEQWPNITNTQENKKEGERNPQFTPLVLTEDLTCAFEVFGQFLICQHQGSSFLFLLFTGSRLSQIIQF